MHENKRAIPSTVSPIGINGLSLPNNICVVGTMLLRARRSPLTSVRCVVSRGVLCRVCRSQTVHVRIKHPAPLVMREDIATHC